MPTTVIEIHVKRLRRRVRLLMAERYGLFGATGGALAGTVLVLLSSKYDTLLDWKLWYGPIVVGAVIGVAFGLLRKLSDLAVAIAADERADLKERLSTAFALTRSGDIDEMGSALVADAEVHAESVRPRDVFPHQWSRPHAVFGVALMILLAAIFIPSMPAFQSRVRKPEIRVMKREGAKLVRIAKEMKRDVPEKREALRRLVNRLQDLGRKMETGRMQKKQAMLQVRKLTQEIKREQDRLAQQNQAAKSMEAAKLEMRKASEDLAKEIARKLAAEEKIPLSKAMNRIPDDKLLKELARKEGPLTATEQKMLEEALEKYADPKNSLPIPPEIGEALAKLAENKDYKKAAEIIQKLLQKLDLERLQKLAKTNGKLSKLDQEMLKKQLEALAKALKGTELDKLAKMLREQAEMLAKLSPEELQALLEKLLTAQMLAKAGGT